MCLPRPHNTTLDEKVDSLIFIIVVDKIRFFQPVKSVCWKQNLPQKQRKIKASGNWEFESNNVLINKTTARTMKTTIQSSTIPRKIVETKQNSNKY